MKRSLSFVLSTLLLSLSTSTIASQAYIENTVEKIYETKYTKQEFFQKAETCLLKTVRNDPVMLVGTSTGYEGIFGVGNRKEAVVSIPAGDVIRHKDTVAEIILANNRIDVKASLVTYSVQTTLELAAKDGKFRLAHNDILHLQKNVGYGTPDSYKKLPAKDKWGSSLSKNVIAALDEITERVAACIQVESNDSNW